LIGASMRHGWRIALCIAGGCGAAACALVTRFDPAVEPDGGGSDAAGEAGVQGCAGSSALFCEDFENGFEASQWTDMTQVGGTATIESAPEHVHWGAHSLHLSSDAAAVDSSNTTIAWRRAGASWPATIYVRGFLFWAAPLASNNVTNNIELENSDRSSGFVLYSGSVFGWTNFGTSVTRTTPSVPATGAWTCVEWLIASSGDVAVWVDGGKIPALEDTSTPVFPITELDVGLLFQHTSPEPAMDVWIDDVVVNDQPIGCGGD
jgi:hypothetical protein